MAEVITASAHGDWRIYACGDFGFVVMYWRPDRDYTRIPPKGWTPAPQRERQTDA